MHAFIPTYGDPHIKEHIAKLKQIIMLICTHTTVASLSDSSKMEAKCIAVYTCTDVYIDYFNLSSKSDRPISSDSEMLMV